MNKRIWITADQHFGHANIIKYCNRPFANVNEMNRTIIENFNALVGPNDETYHIGDFCFKRDPSYYLQHLNGKHYLIRGNHDHHNKIKGFEWAKDVMMLKTEEGMFWLSHYAHRAWPQQHYGTYHLYGHSHGNLQDARSDKGTKLYTNSKDIGVDTNNYYPYSLEHITE